MGREKIHHANGLSVREDDPAVPPTIEIHMRGFYTCEHGFIVPALKVTLTANQIAEGDELIKTLRTMYKQMIDHLDDETAPFRHVRPMTPTEVETYREGEPEED